MYAASCAAELLVVEADGRATDGVSEVIRTVDPEVQGSYTRERELSR